MVQPRIISVDKALRDKNLLGAALGPATSWETWLTVLRAAFALDLSDKEMELFHSVAGERRPPSKRVRELWCLVGRRGGKSKMAGLIAVYIACFIKHRLSPGEVGVALVLAASAEQAQVVFNYAKAALTASPILRREIDSITRNEIRLRNGIVIAVHANSFRTSRGRTVVACIFDECSFWRSDDSAIPDAETYSAILPSLSTTNGMLISISSAYRRAGLMYTKWRDHHGQDSDDTLVVRGGSTMFNPTLDQAVIAAQSAADPVAARSEWDSEFRSDLSAFLDDTVIDRAVDYSRPLELPYLDGLFYRAFCDASGGVGKDAYTVAIAHKEGEHYVVDVVRGTKGAFDPQAVTEQYAGLCREYKIFTVTGDAYAAQWVAGAWTKTSVTYVRSDIPKSQIYLEAAPLFARGLVVLPDHQKLLRELRLLERRTHRSGRDTVDHGRNGHDDHSNAVCGVLRVLSDHLGGGAAGLDYSGFMDTPAEDPALVRTEIAMRRWREELAKISRPPQPPWDLLAQIEQLRGRGGTDATETE
jgi:hypothetical protein